MLKACNFRYGVAAAHLDGMYGWPGMTRVKDGELLVMASERKYHVCPFGREVIMRSIDSGETWSLPQEIYNSELDDRDSTLVTMPDGTIIAGFFTDCGWMEPPFLKPEWEDRRRRISEQMKEQLVGDWLIRSFDGGYTWETEPRRMPDGGAEHMGPFVLSDGNLVCFGYEWEQDGLSMFFYKSKDKGGTWERLGKIPCCEKVQGSFPWRLCRGKKALVPWVNERSMIELSPGHLLAMFRTYERKGFFAQSHSDDGGATWSEPEIVPIIGKPPHLLLLHNGAILCSYSHRKVPFSIRAVISYDNGITWDAENIITLYQWQDKPDMGYPVSLEIEHGEILTVYYCNRRLLPYQQELGYYSSGHSSLEGLLYTKFTLK